VIAPRLLPPLKSPASALETRYRRAQVFGLLFVAAIILAAALHRADAHILFPAGWWHF
jgi:hypothetical protein